MSSVSGLRLSACVLLACVVLQGLSVDARQSQSPAGAAAAQADKSDARRVGLFEGAVSFVPPEGFSKMSDEIVAIKFPDARGPGVFYGNERTTVSIAVTFPEQRVLRPDQLNDFKAFMETFLEKNKKGIEWLKKEIIEIDSQKWIHFEMISQAVDTKIHNHMYITSLDGRMLMFNFNSTAEDYAAHRDALEKSKDSIRIKR